MAPGIICGDQMALFGHRKAVGFGLPEFYIQLIDRSKANETIIKNHYSHRIYSASWLHLGVYIDDGLVGVLQFGPAMNPQSMAGVVRNTKFEEYLELNRMWLDDVAPRNSESRAISYAIKYIKVEFPAIKWIQSFADERCGGLGVVYQASNFLYIGEHTATFWELDGETYHNSLMTRLYETAPPRGRHLQDNRSRAVSNKFRQFRYIKFLKRSARKGLIAQPLPYPKPE